MESLCMNQALGSTGVRSINQSKLSYRAKYHTFVSGGFTVRTEYDYDTLFQDAHIGRGQTQRNPTVKVQNFCNN